MLPASCEWFYVFKWLEKIKRRLVILGDAKIKWNLNFRIHMFTRCLGLLIHQNGRKEKWQEMAYDPQNLKCLLWTFYWCMQSHRLGISLYSLVTSLTLICLVFAEANPLTYLPICPPSSKSLHMLPHDRSCARLCGGQRDESSLVYAHEDL